MSDASVYQVVASKRDTRAYTEQPIPEETARRILQAGRMAGSSKNVQPVRFVVIRERAQKEALAACGDWAAHLPSAPLVVALILLPDGGPFDAGRAAQNMMITAWAEGIASCPTSIHRPEDGARVLALPPGYRIAITLPFGYPAETPARRSQPRLPLSEYLHEERWGG